ncbi:hypothetical protein EST38_g6344 [Candolleomyces aberdarensis]|uniref:AB hydrolase-1 domain-containing protein n=1 Tax=Candolleomyces aberdarensis TaxID=2316362 RepID=A0A4Q2DK05_9AGAR|nr:hypothetical protein EST38_g6344 [Candolleomyces aberdarensis]
MLGYGGTDKPEEYTQYLHSLLAQDLVDLLDHEAVTDVIALGHDWGSRTASALAHLHPDRFIGFGFFAVGYSAPNTSTTYDQLQAQLTQLLGYNNFGYWEFFASPDAGEVILKHTESFWDILYTKDTRTWLYNMCPPGAIRVFIETDSRTPRDPAMDQLHRIYDKEFAKAGFGGPLNYYKIAVSAEELEDGKKVPLENYKVQKPVFIGCTKRDVICLPALAQATARQFCPQATIETFDAGHWVLAQAPNEVNSALEKWINSIVA